LTGPKTAARPYIRPRASGPFWYAKWSRNGKPVVRALGRAWVEADGDGGWKRKRGTPHDGALTETEAATRMLQLVREHDTEATRAEQAEDERRRRGVTFRELVAEWLVYLKTEKSAKPSTLADYAWMVAEPGAPHKRGHGTSPGLLMAALGDRPILQITTREVATFLRDLDKRGCHPRTVNKHRQVISAAFNYGMREDTYSLPANPAAGTNKRREPPKQVLEFYEPDEIELIARTAARGAHRWVAGFLAQLEHGLSAAGAAGSARVSLHAVAAEVDANPWFADQLRKVPSAFAEVEKVDGDTVSRRFISDAEAEHRCREDKQDADLYRVAAFTGLRMGELRALRWGDVHLEDRRLVISRAFSADVEGPTKSWQARHLPLADGVVEAFERLAARDDYISPDDFVFCNRLGRPLVDATLRIRFKKTAAAAGLRVLKFHGLRHGAGSLVAREADARWVQGFLGHSKLSTTERYLHTKARADDVDRLNRAFETHTSDVAR